MAIIRIHTGSDGKSHFQEIVPKLEPRGDKSETAELIPGSGIIVRRFEPTRSNPWHHAPGRYAVAGRARGRRRLCERRHRRATFGMGFRAGSPGRQPGRDACNDAGPRAEPCALRIHQGLPGGGGHRA